MTFSTIFLLLWWWLVQVLSLSGYILCLYLYGSFICVVLKMQWSNSLGATRGSFIKRFSYHSLRIWAPSPEISWVALPILKLNTIVCGDSVTHHEKIQRYKITLHWRWRYTIKMKNLKMLDKEGRAVVSWFTASAFILRGKCVYVIDNKSVIHFKQCVNFSPNKYGIWL